MVDKSDVPFDLSIYVWKLSQRIEQLEHQLQESGAGANGSKIKIEIDIDNPTAGPPTKKDNELNFNDLIFHQLYNNSMEIIYGPLPNPKPPTADIKPDLPQRPTFDPPARQSNQAQTSTTVNKPTDAHPLRICTICRAVLSADAKDKTMEFYNHQTRAHFFYALDKSATEGETRCKLNDCRDQFSSRSELILHMGATHGLSKFILDKLKETMAQYGGVENNGYKCFVDECEESAQRHTIGQLMIHLGNVHYSTEILAELSKYHKYHGRETTKACPIDFCSVKHDKESDMMYHFGIEHCAVWGIARKASKSPRSKQMIESLSPIVLAFSSSLGTPLTSCEKETNGTKCMQVSSSKKLHIHHLMTMHNPKGGKETASEKNSTQKPKRNGLWHYQCPINSKHRFNKDNDEEKSINALLAHLCGTEHFEVEFEKTLEDKYPNCPISEKCKCYKFMLAEELKQHMKVRHPEFLLTIFQTKFPHFASELCLHENPNAKTSNETTGPKDESKPNKSSGKQLKSKKKSAVSENNDRVFELYRTFCHNRSLEVTVVSISAVNDFIKDVHCMTDEATVQEIEDFLGILDAISAGTSKNKAIVKTLKTFKEMDKGSNETPKPKKQRRSIEEDKTAKEIKTEMDITEDLPLM